MFRSSGTEESGRVNTDDRLDGIGNWEDIMS